VELTLKNGQQIHFRPYQETDFPFIQQLNATEGWNNLVEKEEETKKAWENSNIAFVAVEKEKIIGYVRGLTDEHITLYICELLIDKDYRGFGIGQELLRYVHRLYPTTRMETLASSTSRTFYEQLGYRAFYGFRKTIHE
jgi:ribosomal protein S18 acetylase RimI-like enzyme